MAPWNQSTGTALNWARPIRNAPPVANGVVSVAVPWAWPSTYSVIAPLAALYVPARWVQAPSWGGAVVAVAERGRRCGQGSRGRGADDVGVGQRQRPPVVGDRVLEVEAAGL